jgi:ankyrin repeat protein
MRGHKRRIAPYTIAALSIAAACFVIPANSQDHDRPGGATNPVKIDDTLEVWLHARAEHTELRGSQPYDFGNQRGVALSLVVAPDGHVVSAEATDGDKELLDQAQRAALGWTYLPFERDGTPIFARIEEGVQLLPPERRPATYRPTPDVNYWNSLKITLSRTGCFGRCPSYAVQIRGDGTVVYEGGVYTAVGGRHIARVPLEVVRDLFAKFRAADFFSTLDEYRFDVSDGATYKLTIKYDGLEKSVTDYAGDWTGMPGGISNLERAIDQAAGTLKWITITRQTVPSLVSDGYFKNRERDTSIIATMITAGATLDSVRELIGLGASLNSKDPNVGTPLAAAARKGEREMLDVLLAAGAGKNDRTQMSMALFSAAENGSPDLVKMFLRLGANPNYFSRTDGGFTPLMSAAAKGSAEAVAALINAGANVDAKEDTGTTALAWAAGNADRDDPKRAMEYESTVRLLLEAGANPNACDSEGDTPFNRGRNPVVTKMLSDRGADPHKRC